MRKKLNIYDRIVAAVAASDEKYALSLYASSGLTFKKYSEAVRKGLDLREQAK